MQIYLAGYDLYSFNWQKVSKARYMAENFPVSQEYQKHNKNNIKHGGNALVKS